MLNLVNAAQQRLKFQMDSYIGRTKPLSRMA